MSLFLLNKDSLVYSPAIISSPIDNQESNGKQNTSMANNEICLLQKSKPSYLILVRLNTC